MTEQSDWTPWARAPDGADYRRHWSAERGHIGVTVSPPPDEPMLPCSANVWTWKVLRDGRMVTHGEAADRQCAARDAMAAARAIAAEVTP